MAWSLLQEQMRCGRRTHASALRGSWWWCGEDQPPTDRGSNSGGSSSSSEVLHPTARSSVALSRIFARRPTKLRRTGIFAEVTDAAFLGGSSGGGCGGDLVLIGDAEGSLYEYA